MDFGITVNQDGLVVVSMHGMYRFSNRGGLTSVLSGAFCTQCVLRMAVKDLGDIVACIISILVLASASSIL